RGRRSGTQRSHDLPRCCKTFAIFLASLQRRANGIVSIGNRVDPRTVPLTEGENSVEDILKFAAGRQLGLTRDDLEQAIMALCSDNRPVPWDPAVGPGRKWLELFLRRHPRLAERSMRICEVDRVVADQEDRIREFD
ncbi:unnamed protein product, partial [Sphacelaria rigidula]